MINSIYYVKLCVDWLSNNYHYHSSFNILIDMGIKHFLKRLYLHIRNLYCLPEGNNMTLYVEHLFD